MARCLTGSKTARSGWGGPIRRLRDGSLPRLAGRRLVDPLTGLVGQLDLATFLLFQCDDSGEHEVLHVVAEFRVRLDAVFLLGEGFAAILRGLFQFSHPGVRSIPAEAVFDEEGFDGLEVLRLVGTATIAELDLDRPPGIAFLKADAALVTALPTWRNCRRSQRNQTDRLGSIVRQAVARSK